MSVGLPRCDRSICEEAESVQFRDQLSVLLGKPPDHSLPAGEVVARLLDVTAKLDREGEALYWLAVRPAPLDPAQPACLDFGVRFAELACGVADGGRDICGRRLQQPLLMGHPRVILAHDTRGVMA